ncbi:cytidine deaminase [Treponema sp.]|uniref:cytidine deaminase n=1 Tax=Treponema sp. TaxID=166 RepID=UPI003F73850F
MAEEIPLKTLIKKAMEMLEFSYAPYSNFHVGAALLADDGKIYTGCNIENSAYGPSNCAERTAVFKAVSEGCRKFRAIAIVGGKNGKPESFCSPCGVCRQVLAEFCDKEFKVVMAKSPDEYRVMTLGQLLPESFSL